MYFKKGVVCQPLDCKRRYIIIINFIVCLILWVMALVIGTVDYVLCILGRFPLLLVNKILLFLWEICYIYICVRFLFHLYKRARVYI